MYCVEQSSSDLLPPQEMRGHGRVIIPRSLPSCSGFATACGRSFGVPLLRPQARGKARGCNVLFSLLGLIPISSMIIARRCRFVKLKVLKNSQSWLHVTVEVTQYKAVSNPLKKSAIRASFPKALPKSDGVEATLDSTPNSTDKSFRIVPHTVRWPRSGPDPDSLVPMVGSQS